MLYFRSWNELFSIVMKIVYSPITNRTYNHRIITVRGYAAVPWGPLMSYNIP